MAGAKQNDLIDASGYGALVKGISHHCWIVKNPPEYWLAGNNAYEQVLYNVFSVCASWLAAARTTRPRSICTNNNVCAVHPRMCCTEDPRMWCGHKTLVVWSQNPRGVVTKPSLRISPEGVHNPPWLRSGPPWIITQHFQSPCAVLYSHSCMATLIYPWATLRFCTCHP